MPEKLLEIKNLKTYFALEDGGWAKAVDDVSFSVDKGETLCIVGESGCGKSMTALSIMDLIARPAGKYMGGQMLFHGKDLRTLSEKEKSSIRGNQIAMIFQEPMTALNPVKKIGTQIAEVLQLHEHMDKKQAMDQAILMLKKVGIPRAEKIVHEYPHQFSGGMRQRVMIAMAMMCNPELLIADEPTTALDVTIQAQVLDLMRTMKREFHAALIFITHDFGVVSEMADNVVVMYAGQIIESGQADMLFERPLHPYTRALLASVPFIDQDKEVLNSIPGTVPEASNYPEGCRFAERCDRCHAKCRKTEPKLQEPEPGHFVKCFWAGDEYCQ